jgi:hypothetical protein
MVGWPGSTTINVGTARVYNHVSVGRCPRVSAERTTSSLTTSEHSRTTALAKRSLAFDSNERLGAMVGGLPP